MGWVKLDDAFFTHRKVEGLSKDAKLLFVAGLTWCARELTDGWISPTGLRTSAALVNVKPSAAKDLVRAGLWDKRDDGHQVHDYLDYQPTKAEAEERRRIRAAAGHKGGVRSARSRQAKASANGQALASAHAPPNAEARPQADMNPVSRTPEPSLSLLSDSRPPSNGSAPGGAGEGKPQVRPHEAALVDRVVALLGGHRRHQAGAVKLVTRWSDVLDVRLIDQAIGMCEQASDQVRDVAYVETTLRRTAAQNGVEVASA